MTTLTVDDPAGELDTVIRNTPGVAALYRTGGLLGTVVAEGKRMLSPDTDTEPYTRIAESDGKPAVTVAIGVNGASAQRVCRAVHDAIRERLRQHGLGEATITVTVAHVAT